MRVYSDYRDCWKFIFHKVVLSTQLRRIFSNNFYNFITNFPQNVPVKKMEIGQYLPKIWTKVSGLLFGVTLYAICCRALKTKQVIIDLNHKHTVINKKTNKHWKDIWIVNIELFPTAIVFFVIFPYLLYIFDATID